MTARVIGMLLIVLAGCGRLQGTDAGAQAAQAGNATLDQLLAPVALYPDALLAQVLMSATIPGNVVKFDRWLKDNQQAKGSGLQDAAVAAGFDPSFVALAPFPQVVARMVERIDWTTAVGNAFTADRTAVFDSIQRLRQQAKAVGTLKNTPQQEVETRTTSSGQQVIVIEPANPQVVYVPQYNPTVVYTQAPTTTTVIVQEDDDDAEEAIAAGLIGFTAGIAIGAAMDNDYYYGPYGWHGGAYMYNDAWDDYWDHREDAREDWMDHREDIMEERGDVAQNRQEQRTERAESGQQQRTERRETSQQQRTERRDSTQQQRTERGQTAGAQTQTAAAQQGSRVGSSQARGYSSGQAATQRSGSGSDAFSGYSSGRSTQSASSRGNRSRSSARSSGGRRR